jgi:hypothetical protein
MPYRGRGGSFPPPPVDLSRASHTGTRARDTVLVSAARCDEMVEREDLVRDLAWAAFAEERIERPTSPPVSWDEAQRRRTRR